MDEVPGGVGGGGQSAVLGGKAQMLFSAVKAMQSLYILYCTYIFRFLHTYFYEHFGPLEKLNFVRLSAFHGKEHYEFCVKMGSG